MSKKLGKLVDELYQLDQKIERMESAIIPFSKKYAALEEQLLKKFNKSELNGATGALAVLTRHEDPVPDVKNWDKLYAHIKKTGGFDLLHKRISTAAWRERLEAKKSVPGVGVFTKISLKVKKRKRK